MTYSLKYMGFRLRQKTAGGNFFYDTGRSGGRGRQGRLYPVDYRMTFFHKSGIEYARYRQCPVLKREERNVILYLAC